MLFLPLGMRGRREQVKKMKILGGSLATRLKKFQRHFGDMLPHVTAGKISNALRAEYEYRKGRNHVKSRPYWLKVETSRICNLSCPGCYAHGRDEDLSYPGEDNKHRLMSFDMFKEIIDQVKRHVFAIQLYDEGEPLLNPDIYRMVRYAHEANVGTVISSNFSMVLRDEDFENMVNFGLDHLVVGIDGITQEIYEKTRVKGNLERVIDNTRRLIRTKRRLKRKKPLVEIQFLQKPFNLHEQEGVEKLAGELGADMFTPVKLALFWVAGEPVQVPPPARCPIPWSTLVIQWNGDVTVCPLTDSPQLFSGQSIADKSLGSILNSDYYHRIRDQHIYLGQKEKVIAPVCLDCGFRR